MLIIMVREYSFLKWEERRLWLFDDNNSNIIIYTFKYIMIKKSNKREMDRI